MKKNVLIIGASGDIGVSIAKTLAKDGYQLILHYHSNKGSIQKLQSEIDQQSILLTIQADLTSEEELKKLLKEVVFSIDIIIFASGKGKIGLFQDISSEDIDEMLTLHVKAPMIITKHFLPNMIQQRSGKIIFITSIWGSVGASLEVLYSAVKGAQNSFIKALAKEVAPSGISVNGVSPGFIDTKMNEHLLEKEKNAIISEIPSQRPGTVQDVSHTIRFLCDDQSSYIQGEIIHVNGGWY